MNDNSIFYDVDTKKIFDINQLRKGEYITAWVSVYEDNGQNTITVDTYSIFKNSKEKDLPDLLPELITIKKISYNNDDIKITDDSEFTWHIQNNTDIESIYGKKLTKSDLKEGQTCLGFIDTKASSMTEETEVISSKIIIVK